METTNGPESSRASVGAMMEPQGVAAAAGVANESQSQLHTGQPPQTVAADALADRIEGLVGNDPITGKDLRALIVAIPDIRAMVVATAVRLLGSQRMMFDVSKKCVERVDDGATQMKAVAFLAAYADGLPVQTTLSLNMDAGKDLPMEEMLRRSPALLAAVKKQIHLAERVQERGSKKAVPVPSETPAPAT